jgi:hypothetical protein
MKFFFGWSNIRWFLIQVGKMYSAEKSYFSKKRIESGLAFAIGQWGMIFFMLEKHESLTMAEVLFWSATEFAIAGYMVNQIEKAKEKAFGSKNETNEEENQINS